MLRPAITILLKDLRLRARDRSVLLFALVVPLGLTLLFSGIVPDAGEVRVRAALVDLDGGTATAAFADQVLPVLEEQGVLDLVEVDGAAAARAAVEDGELDAAWVVPDGFEAALTSGARAELEVLVNPQRAVEAEVARGVATAVAARLDAVRLAVGSAAASLGSDADPQQLAEVARRAATAPPPLEVTALVDDTERLSSTSYLAAGMAAFFVFFVVQFGVTGQLEERELGTAPRLAAAPIPPASIQLGKALGAVVLGITSMTVLAVASTLLLDAAWGPPVGVAILILAIVAAATGLMLLVGTFARTSEQAGNLQAIVAIVLGMVGGTFFPLPGDAAVLRVASSASPHAWFLRGLGDLVGEGRWTAVLPATGAILAFGVVGLVLAALRRRREVRW